MIVKLRETDTGDIIEEIEEDIEILKDEDDESGGDDGGEDSNDNNKDSVQKTNNKATITGNVIKLGNRNELQGEKEDGDNGDDDKNVIVYESGSEKVKKYAIYGLNAILVVIIILLVKKKV